MLLFMHYILNKVLKHCITLIIYLFTIELVFRKKIAKMISKTKLCFFPNLLYFDKAKFRFRIRFYSTIIWGSFRIHTFSRTNQVSSVRTGAQGAAQVALSPPPLPKRGTSLTKEISIVGHS